MKVVADTSVINYLTLINAVRLLPYLFGKIIIPEAVFQELSHEHTPPVVRDLIRTGPEWLEIRSVGQSRDAALASLHPGEKEVIILAEKIKADLVILDDWEARRFAEDRRLKVCGLLKILELGDIHHRVSLPRAIEKLRRTNFKVSDRLIRKILLRHLERQRL